MPYATEADLVAAAGGLARLNQLLGKPAPAAEPDAREYWLAQALLHGDGKLNGYLASRYATPLAAPSPVVIQAAAEEAIYWLASVHGMATDHDVALAEVRMELYRDLRDGKVWPGDEPPKPTTGRKSTFVASKRTVRLSSLKGFI